jgi:hypothetical protein
MVGWLRVVHAARPELSPSDAHQVASWYLMADKYNDPQLARELSAALGGSDPFGRSTWAYGQHLFRDPEMQAAMAAARSRQGEPSA